MENKQKQLGRSEVDVGRKRRLQYMHLQAMEGSPLDAEDIAMFEMFEREAWSFERCEKYLIESVSAKSRKDEGA